MVRHVLFSRAATSPARHSAANCSQHRFPVWMGTWHPEAGGGACLRTQLGCVCAWGVNRKKWLEREGESFILSCAQTPPVPYPGDRGMGTLEFIVENPPSVPY